MGRGRYFLNPYLYGRGTAANILERQKEWDALQSRKKDESPPDHHGQAGGVFCYSGICTPFSFSISIILSKKSGFAF